MNAITRGIRGAGRNAIRAFAIVVILGISLGLSLTMLIANKSISRQLETTLSAIGTTVNITPDEVSNVELDMAQVDRVRSLSHVARLTTSLDQRVITTGNKGDADDLPAAVTSLRVVDIALPPGKEPNPNLINPTFFGLSDPTDAAALRAGSFQLMSGQGFDGLKPHRQALLSTAMATKNNLTVGSTFTAYSETFTVTGLYKTDSPNQVDRRSVIVSLPTIQRLSGKTGKIWEAFATVDSLRNLAATTTAIRQTLSGQPVEVASQQDQADAAIRPLANIQRISLYSMIGAVVASAAIVLLTMIMIVRERRREIGILKAIGLTNRRIIAQYMSESLTFTLGGAILGIIIGALAGSSVTNALATGATGAATNAGGAVTTAGGKDALAAQQAVVSNIGHITGQIDWTIVAFGLGAAILLALVGSALAAFFITKIRPAEVLRSE